MLLAFAPSGLLCREVQVNFAYRWFCKLGIEHSDDPRSLGIFASAQRAVPGQRHLPAGISSVSWRPVSRPELVGGEGFAVDASLIEADANKHRSIPGSEWQKTCDRQTASSSHAGVSHWQLLMTRPLVRRASVTPKFRVAVRSGRSMDQRAAKVGVLRLRRQLSLSTWEVWDYHGCRAHRAPSGRPRSAPRRP